MNNWIRSFPGYATDEPQHAAEEFCKDQLPSYPADDSLVPKLAALINQHRANPGLDEYESAAQFVDAHVWSYTVTPGMRGALAVFLRAQAKRGK